MTTQRTKLSVNVNAVAYLRNRRDVPWPSLVDISRAILEAGADGITVHPRPDQRHIRFSDIADLSNLIASEFPHAEFNIEGYPSPDFTQLVLSANAHQVTLVPDSPEQATSDHGWDFAKHQRLLEDTAKTFKDNGLRVSFFIDANTHDPFSAWQAGAHRVELYTGPYGAQINENSAKGELEKLKEAAAAARYAGDNNKAGHSGLGINAGHDISLGNLPALIAAIPDIAEVSIGHALTSDALMLGFPAAVRRYQQVLNASA